MAQKYTKNSMGYYHTRVWDGTWVNGKKHYKQVYSSKSSKDLERKVLEITTQVNNRVFTIKGDQSFTAYADQWLKTYKASKSDNTKFMYQNLIDKHFACITCNISDLTRSDYVNMMNAIKGNRTKQQAAMAFKQILKSAIHDKLLPAAALEEVLDGVDKVKYKPDEKRPLTEAEKAAIKAVDLSARDKAFLYLLYGCGIRRGECAALTRSDVNLDDLTLNVDKAYAYVEGRVILKDTKNTKHRVIPIPQDIVPILKEYFKELQYNELFAMKDGKSLTKSSLDKMWRRILKGLQNVSEEPIEGLTPHIFRHNYCTILCKQVPAISLTDVAYLVGDSLQVVLNVYNHLQMDKTQVSNTVTSAFKL